jgi:hypothetical protein
MRIDRDFMDEDIQKVTMTTDIIKNTLTYN